MHILAINQALQVSRARQSCLHGGGIEAELDGLLFNALSSCLFSLCQKQQLSMKSSPTTIHTLTFTVEYIQKFNTSQCQGLWKDRDQAYKAD